MSRGGFVLVRYQDDLRLRIPLAATNLVGKDTPAPLGTKLSPAALNEFLALVQEDISCGKPSRSGRGSRPT
jgi:hypothetical protein